MDRWRGKTAVVTGAASGIGAAIAKALMEEGINVAGFDIQYERVKKMAEDMKDKTIGKMHPVLCDLTKKEDTKGAFKYVNEHLHGVDIMVNNAGVVHYSKVIETEREVFEKLLDINVLAVATCIREAVTSMRERGMEGHIFNINSVLGHEIPEQALSEGWNLYPSCKHATVALTHVVRRELVDVKANIRMTSVSPGLVKTEITKDTQLKDLFENTAALDPGDVANAVVYALGTRPEVQITEITIRRTGEL